MLLVQNGFSIRYGGGGAGLMGAIADEAISLKGKITGIIPLFMIEEEWEHKGVVDMIRVETMQERKHLLLKDSYGVIALPGGSGTLEELYETVSLKKLGFYPYPIILLNTNGYYDLIIEMARKMARERFTREEHLDIWTIAATPSEVIKNLNQPSTWHPDAIKMAAVKDCDKPLFH